MAEGECEYGTEEDILGLREAMQCGSEACCVIKNTDIYSSHNIIWVTKSRRTTCAEHVARTKKRRDAHRALVEKPEEKSPLGEPRSR
jgi:hypothetical protein